MSERSQISRIEAVGVTATTGEQSSGDLHVQRGDTMQCVRPFY